jgi:hypothetical protein
MFITERQVLLALFLMMQKFWFNQRVSRPSIAKLAIAPLMVLCLLLTGQAVLAETERIVYSMTPKPGQEFNDLMREAELVARDAVERAFANPSVTDVELQIVGDRNGDQVPLLSTLVTRSEWQSRPIIRAWTQYFGTVPSALLGFRPSDAPAPPEPSTASITFGYVPPPEGISPQSISRQGTGVSRIQEEARFQRDPAYRDD